MRSTPVALSFLCCTAIWVVCSCTNRQVAADQALGSSPEQILAIANRVSAAQPVGVDIVVSTAKGSKVTGSPVRSNPGLGIAQFTITVPKDRRYSPQYISMGSKVVALSIDSTSDVPFDAIQTWNLKAPGDATLCTASVPVGPATFSMTVLSKPLASTDRAPGDLDREALSAGTASAVISGDGTSRVKMLLWPIPASVAVATPSEVPTYGSSNTHIPIDISIKDAAGYVISGPFGRPGAVSADKFSQGSNAQLQLNIDPPAQGESYGGTAIAPKDGVVSGNIYSAEDQVFLNYDGTGLGTASVCAGISSPFKPQSLDNTPFDCTIITVASPSPSPAPTATPQPKRFLNLSKSTITTPLNYSKTTLDAAYWDGGCGGSIPNANAASTWTSTAQLSDGILTAGYNDISTEYRLDCSAFYVCPNMTTVFGCPTVQPVASQSGINYTGSLSWVVPGTVDYGKDLVITAHATETGGKYLNGPYVSANDPGDYFSNVVSTQARPDYTFRFPASTGDPIYPRRLGDIVTITISAYMGPEFKGGSESYQYTFSQRP